MQRVRKAFLIAAVPVAGYIGAGIADDYVRGAAFVIQAAGLNGTVRTLAEWRADEVTETAATIPWRDGTLNARIYRPATKSYLREPDSAPALLVPGVHAAGIDEPRLVQFARDVASMGKIVVTAELIDLKRYRITARSTDQIEDAARWLSAQPSLSPDGRVELMGISFAGGLSVVAAGRPSLRDRIAAVMSFGGHGDLPRTLQYLCTGRQPDGSMRPPHDYGVAIILLGVADRVVPQEQVQRLLAAILAFLHASHTDMWNKEQAATEFARAKTMAESLPEPARTLMNYVNTRDVARLGPILLPHAEAMGGDEALSPSRSPAPAAPVYLLHGADDNVIPAVESTLLAETLRGRGARVTLLATSLITHAEVDRSPSPRAVWELVRFWTELLDEQ